MRALVLLALAVDVEIAQPDHLRGALRPVAAHILVEQELGIAVDVERRFARAVLAEFGTGAVDRGRRRVDVRNLLVAAVFEQLARILVIVLHHVAAVGFGGVRARALVRNRGDRAVERAVAELAQKGILVEIVGDVAIDEIDEFVALFQVVDRQHFVFAARIQRLDDVRSDKPGGAGDYDVHDVSSILLFKQFLGTHHRGAEFADDDAGGTVGDAHRVREIGSRPPA